VSAAPVADDIRRVGVVGCGAMGSGIAEVCAREGLDVRVVVSGATRIEPGRRRLAASLDRAVAGGRLDQAQRDAAVARVQFTERIEDLADRQFVFECVTEDAAAKLKVFAELDRVVEDEEAIFASNTSSLPVVRLARACERPGRVVGTHFFNPVPLLPLVELTGSLLTDARTMQRTEDFIVGALGKTVIRSRDRAGFVVNALLVPYLMSAVRMVESGFASAEDIDQGMRLGCAHPIGPLALADLIGLDTLAAVTEGLYAEFRDPAFCCPPLLGRMVEGGLLGKKSGRGFHHYPQAVAA
jgi:3-hydroxybutyryl-CoA dehydrogenase